MDYCICMSRPRIKVDATMMVKKYLGNIPSHKGLLFVVVRLIGYLKKVGKIIFFVPVK